MFAFTIQVRKGTQILDAALNVVAYSKFAKLQQVPYDSVVQYLFGQTEAAVGSEIDRNICLLWCAIEEGFRVKREKCPFVYDDILDWLISNEAEVTNAIVAIYDKFTSEVNAILEAEKAQESSDDAKKK